MRPNHFAGISAAGTIAGEATIVTGTKGKRTITSQVNYRFNPDIDGTYQDLQASGISEDINNFEEILLRSQLDPAIYRDWNDGEGERAVSLLDLVVGDEADLAQFPNHVDLWHMNDAGIIVGSLYDDDHSVETIVVLTPEPASP